MGVAHSEEEATALEAEARHWIATYGGQQLIDFEGRAEKELRTAEDVLSSITSTRLSAAQTIIGKVYDSIGFNEIEDEELLDEIAEIFEDNFDSYENEEN